MSKNQKSQNDFIVLLFLLIPTLMLFLGYFLYPYPPSELAQQLVNIPLFGGIIFLGIGFFWRQKYVASILKMIGWSVFAFFWATSPSYLYYSEGGDVFNAAVCIIGVYVLMYLAYHEWLSLERQDYPSCLNWIAGGSFVAGLIYFSIDSNLFPFLKEGLIELVAEHSTLFMNLFSLDAIREGSTIVYNETPISIIFACTAIQSIVLFVGMIAAITNASIKRKIVALFATVFSIYFLNLIRNAGVIFLVGSKLADFNLAHNIIAKLGSLLALIALLFITFKILPELYDEIMCLIDLPKRDGPLETFFTRKGKR